MSTDVKVERWIARPRAQVAAFMFDPLNDAAWTSGVIAVKPLGDGRLRAGRQVERTVKFLGRRFSYLYEVTAAEGDAFVEMRVEQPFPMEIRYQLDDADGGTRATIFARGEAGGFYRLAAPLLNWMVKKNIARDLERLKRAVEK